MSAVKMVAPLSCGIPAHTKPQGKRRPGVLSWLQSRIHSYPSLGHRSWLKFPFSGGVNFTVGVRHQCSLSRPCKKLVR